MTPKAQIDRFVRNEREARIAAEIDELAKKFAERSTKHDREGSFPHENVADLRQAGYLKLTVPRAYGGDEASLYELVLAQDHLARGDGSTALAVGWHLGQVMQLRINESWPDELYRSLCEEIVGKGVTINSFASERATGSPSRGGKPETSAVRTEAGWLISGRKTYSTLSPDVTYFTLSASIEGEDRIGEFLVRMGSGITIEETWDTLGMRATGSHDLVLDNVFVPHGETLEGAEIKSKAGTAYDSAPLLHIPACYIGIAHAARDFAIKFAKNYRPNSLPGPISELPNIQRQIGEMEAELITARTLLYSVADRWDHVPSERSALKQELGLAKYVATNSAIHIVDKAMRIVGAASLSRKLPLERMYRDVRAGLHNPPMDDIALNNLAQRAIAEEN
ncbi:alkylation response protein AidB-like acyl-CoA dehydrogenase [Paenibacillus castaneae]|uniref:acyl-CoA dehydrogenase family protein n=1 Tax=Paenibacillus castaneae TaxID=474957 RepID=UPI000C9CB06A|nr:acyl-CoA dehydrogenase family protein [Paenibacillus castaneae]NIK74945.1 alkylation response protein AidB-like acyl-CoA dehydrogenase [Paenibacillus castaneae]